LTVKIKKAVKINVLRNKYMVNQKTIQEISQKIKHLVSDSPISDIDENINALLKGMFTKMDLITREEFDVQTGVLKKTREKLENIEKKLSKIEKGIK
jgi:hypothetical protein